MIEKYGYSAECPGCQQAQEGKRVTGHSTDCRARIEESMQKDDDGQARLQRRDVRRGTARETESVIEIAADNTLPEDEKVDVEGEGPG